MGCFKGKEKERERERKRERERQREREREREKKRERERESKREGAREYFVDIIIIRKEAKEFVGSAKIHAKEKKGGEKGETPREKEITIATT